MKINYRVALHCMKCVNFFAGYLNLAIKKLTNLLLQYIDIIVTNFIVANFILSIIQ